MILYEANLYMLLNMILNNYKTHSNTSFRRNEALKLI